MERPVTFNIRRGIKGCGVLAVLCEEGSGATWS